MVLSVGVKEVMFKLPEAMWDTMNRDATSYYIDDVDIIISDYMQKVLSMHPLKEYMGELSDDSSESHQGPSSVLVKEQPGKGQKVKKRKKLLPRGKNMVEG